MSNNASITGLQYSLQQIIHDVEEMLALPFDADLSLDGLDHRVEGVCAAALRLGPDRAALQPLMDQLNDRLEQLGHRMTERRDQLSHEMNRQTVRTTAFRAYTRTQR